MTHDMQSSYWKTTYDIPIRVQRLARLIKNMRAKLIT